MTEGYSISFGRIVIGWSKTHSYFGKEISKDDVIYHAGKLYLWIKPLKR